MALSTQVTRPALPFARRCLASRKAKSHSRSVTLAADAERVEDDVGTVAAAHLARREQALRRLADQDAIDPRRALVGQRRRRAGEDPHRPHPGVQLETIAEIEMRRHFGAVGIPHVGQSHRAEQDGIGGFGALQRHRRQGLARAPVQFGAGFEGGEVEREASDPLGDRVEQRDTRRHDLDADAVAWEDCYLELAHTHP